PGSSKTNFLLVARAECGVPRLPRAIQRGRDEGSLRQPARALRAGATVVASATAKPLRAVRLAHSEGAPRLPRSGRQEFLLRAASDDRANRSRAPQRKAGRIIHCRSRAPGGSRTALRQR